MKKIVILSFIFSSFHFLFAQERMLPSFELIDLPTAGTLDRGSYVSELRLYPSGGLLGGLKIG